MKIFTFTSDTFSGHWEFEFDAAGYLKLASNNSKMNDMQLSFLKSNFPVHEKLLPILNGKTARITEITDLSFDMFWDRYDYKQARVNAERAWKRLSKDEKIKAVEGIAPYAYHLQLNPSLPKMLPATYLNGKRFLDEWPHQIKMRKAKERKAGI